MIFFRWKAIDSYNQIHTGYIFASSKNEVKLQLHEQQKVVIEIIRYSPLYLCFVYKKLWRRALLDVVSLMSACVPFERSLRSVAIIYEKQPYIAHLLLIMADHVLEGKALADITLNQQRIIGNWCSRIFKAGLESESAIELLQDYITLQNEHEKTIRSLMRNSIMPVVAIIGAIVMLIVMSIWIVPSLLTLYATLNIHVPPFLTTIVNIKTWFMSYGLLVFSILLGIGYWALRRVQDFILVQIARELFVAQWSLSFGTFLSRNINTLQACRLSGMLYERNSYLSADIQLLENRIQAGYVMYEALKQTRILCMSELLAVVATAMTTRELGERLVVWSKIRLSQFRDRMQVWQSLLLLFLYIAMASLLLALAWSLYSPLLDIAGKTF